jgi:hypothetical protein
MAEPGRHSGWLHPRMNAHHHKRHLQHAFFPVGSCSTHSDPQSPSVARMFAC